jgi:hypothetical protein
MLEWLGCGNGSLSRDLAGAGRPGGGEAWWMAKAASRGGGMPSGCGRPSSGGGRPSVARVDSNRQQPIRPNA